jgi:hypothetical protein
MAPDPEFSSEISKLPSNVRTNDLEHLLLSFAARLSIDIKASVVGAIVFTFVVMVVVALPQLLM